MRGRDLSSNVGNVIDLDIFIRDNKHSYDAFLYGFRVEKDIAANVMMALSQTIEMKLLFYLRTMDIVQVVDTGNIKIRLKKYIKSGVLNTVLSHIEFVVNKIMRGKIIHTLNNKINVSVKKLIASADSLMSFVIGTLNSGKVIIDIEGLLVSDIQDLTIDELCRGSSSIYGIKLGIVKPTRISDIQNMTISQIEDMTIEELCYTIIA